jgi:hypothetical protein
MVPVNLLQHDNPWSVQLCSTGYLGRNELSWCRGRAIARSGQRSQCADFLLDGVELLLLECDREVSWHQGRIDIRDVSCLFNRIIHD